MAKLKKPAAVSDSGSFQQPRIDFNREDAFQLYATFCGDVERTAHALNVPAVAILKVVEEENWSARLRSILELKKSNRPGDVERAINRALNFVQAHRLRLFLERMMSRLTNMSPEEAEEYLMQESVTKDGNISKKLSTRPLADLAAALEKCHAMTYMALNDSAAERTRRNETGDPASSSGELHKKIAEGMAAIRSSTSPRAQLLDAQLAQGQAVGARNPRPDDTHEGEDG